LRELERMKEEEEHERINQEIRDEHTRSARVAEKRKELSMKASAIEEWQQHETERTKQKKEQAGKKNKEVFEQLYTLGYTEKEVEKILLHRKRNGQEGEEKHKEHAMEGKKTTWIKVRSTICPSNEGFH
jgi:Holliday junction resolvasome RuvABC DNA-binding subunit